MTPRPRFDELLPMLVSVDIAGEQNAVRRRAPLANLTSTPGRQLLTERLVRARFLTTDEQDGNAIASFAHEALLRRWDRITGWINSNRDLLRMRTRIEQYQGMWEESGCDPSRLLPTGLPLEEGRKLREAIPPVLEERTKQFVAASATHHERAQRRAALRRRVAFTVLSALTVLALVAGFWAYRSGLEANKQRDAAEHERIEALRQKALADTQSALVTKEKENPKGITSSISPAVALTRPCSGPSKSIVITKDWLT